MLDVALQIGLADFTTNETLGIKYRVGWIRVECVLGGITNSGRRVNATPNWKAT